jgi:two-component system nitrate/nitrite response regulator NarL
VIVDDHKLFAEAVEVALGNISMSVEGIATTAEEGLRLVRRVRPDIVLVDIGLPDRSGLSLGQDILEELPDAKVLALTALDDSRTAEEARRIGFAGYLTKETPIGHFAQSLQAAMDGQHVVSRPARWIRDDDRNAEVRLLASQLTSRELEVLSLLVDGLRGPEIARELSISKNTVRTHIQSILTKLQVHSRLEAATFAIRNRIVQVDARARPSNRP